MAISPSPTPTHLLLDMGGVLIDIEWQQRIQRLLGRDLPMVELHHLWVHATSTLDFESGRTTFDEFATAFITEFDLSVTPATVQSEFLEIVQAPKPNCETILSQLRSRYHLSLLSNTNVPHVERLRSRYSFFRHLDETFLSYELGMMKPSPQIFQHVMATLGVTPEATAFFDDSQANVDAACALGIQGFRVDSPQAILAVLG